jgi:Na+/melibiose symporter-like transporter
MTDKKTRRKRLVNIIMFLFGIIGFLLLTLSVFFIKNKESRDLAKWIGYGLLWAGLIFRFFESEFGHKPTREEIEEEQFGKTGGR